MDEETEEQETEENKEDKWENFKEKMKENPWRITSFVFILASLILLILALKPGITGNVIKGEDAGEKLVAFINTNFNADVKYISYEDLGNIYEVTVEYKGDNIPVYITKDGKYFVQGISPLSGQAVSEPTQAQPTQEPNYVPKTDKPKVELFIMTHCPYGLQAEKGIIPAIKTLGNDIDATIRFVHYFMHGDKEEQETYRQLCIREEQTDKFLSYLECFLGDGDSERCVGETGINKVKLDSCLQDKAKDYYAEDSELSQKYGVRGSPTLILNEAEARSARSPADLLFTICSAFNTPPEGCSAELSTANPSSGFGYSTTSSSTSAQC